jgi:hypothetical protein
VGDAGLVFVGGVDEVAMDSRELVFIRG